MSENLALGDFPNPVSDPLPYWLAQAFGAAANLCLYSRGPYAEGPGDAHDYYAEFLGHWNALACLDTRAWEELLSWKFPKEVAEIFAAAGAGRLPWLTVWETVAAQLQQLTSPAQGDVIWACRELKLHVQALQGNPSGPPLEMPILPPQSEKSKAPRQTAPLSKPTLQSRALTLFMDDPKRTKRDIADLLKCTPQNISKKRCPKLDAAMKAYKSNSAPRRGRKDEAGSIEAVDDEADEG